MKTLFCVYRCFYFKKIQHMPLCLILSEGIESNFAKKLISIRPAMGRESHSQGHSCGVMGVSWPGTTSVWCSEWITGPSPDFVWPGDRVRQLRAMSLVFQKQKQPRG